MHFAALMDILGRYPQDMEVEMAVIAPVEAEDEPPDAETFDFRGVLRWEDEEEGATFLWLVGGEAENIAAFLDFYVLDDGDDQDD